MDPEVLLENNLRSPLLRLSTAGSVDDGKSTLIGRLLHDTKSIYQDQIDAAKKESASKSNEDLSLSYLLDGLKSEREQGITIDVAYRYFSTPKRRFIIADTPGHEQYTRNMVTGASNADLAIILIDARKGISVQSKRHGFIASLLGIPHFVIAINKMDLVDYSEDVFRRICDEYGVFATKLEVKDIKFIPVSALKGDNIVDPSRNMPWYDGEPLLKHMESVYIGGNRNLIDFRFPVQLVLRPNQDFRGFAGTVASGVVRVGDEVMALPSRKISRVK
ncbi:MAG: GTP-binding protein, partial [Nitrospinota bacterium]|nr:GTP-binding protein [Nitrospinota bacterium]